MRYFNRAYALSIFSVIGLGMFFTWGLGSVYRKGEAANPGVASPSYTRWIAKQFWLRRPVPELILEDGFEPILTNGDSTGMTMVIGKKCLVN